MGIFESETNDTLQTASVVTQGIAISGQLSAYSDKDLYAIMLKNLRENPF